MTTLGDVAHSMKNGIYRPASFYSDDGIACLRMYNIDKGKIVWRGVKRMNLTEDEIVEYELLPGDLLVNRVNSRELVGKAAEIPTGCERCVFESKNIRVRLRKEAVVPAFVNYRLLLAGSDYFTRNAQQVVGMASVNQPQVAHFQLPLAPIREQERIVEKLDALMSRVAAGETAARRALERLHRYRAAVLHAAVTGELTREWRKTHKPDETGAQLLNRLLDERRGQWEEAELKRLQAAGKPPNDDKWKTNYKEPSPPQVDDLARLPREWKWASLEMIAELGSGISVSQNRTVTSPIEVPYLRVANVLRGRLDLTEIKMIRVNREHLESFLLSPGDILFNEGGDRDKLGRGWIWEGQIPNCVHQNHVFRARLVNRALIDAKLISHWGNTYGQRFFMRHGTQTTNLASINRTVLARLPLPIIPLAEQGEISRELGRRLAAAERLAETINRQIERASATRKSLLREAFAGNMVPQNPNDEPALVLLERIKAAREAEAKKPKPKRMPKTKLTFATWKMFDLIKAEFGDRLFTFDALRKAAHSVKYDDLRTELYEMLRPTSPGAKPVLQMTFDAEKERMEFRIHQS